VNSAALIAARLLVAVVIRLRAAVKVIKLFFHDIHAPDTTLCLLLDSLTTPKRT